jgi:hypothetical protein
MSLQLADFVAKVAGEIGGGRRGVFLNVGSAPSSRSLQSERRL